jgi:hypothetical protein
VSYAIYMPAGGGFLDFRSLSSLTDDTRTPKQEGTGAGREGDPKPRLPSNLPDPYPDEPKYPAWKVTVAVIVFCTAFWLGVGYLISRLFSN